MTNKIDKGMTSQTTISEDNKKIGHILKTLGYVYIAGMWVIDDDKDILHLVGSSNDNVEFTVEELLIICKFLKNEKAVPDNKFNTTFTNLLIEGDIKAATRFIFYLCGSVKITIPKEVIKSKETFKKWMGEVVPEQKYEFGSASSVFDWFKIDIEFSDNEFSWTMKARGCAGHTYPMKNSEYVKTFKTEKGAKNNLIGFIDWIWE